MNSIKNIFAGALVLLVAAAQAQLTTPQPSPTATINQKLGLTDISVTYSRPGAKNRVVFGELVPFGKVWRTGANKATSVTFSTDVNLGGKDVKAGTYSLFTIPNSAEWTVILNSNTELWGAGKYDEAKDVARFTIKPTILNDIVETFTIDFSHLVGSDGHMNLSWENTRVAIAVKTDANGMIEKQIKEILVDGPSAGTYYNAARFYVENDKDMNQALTWINAAINTRPEAFWYMHYKAKIQAKMGKTKEAIATAEKSLTMAKENEDGDYGYIANNEKLIAELKKK
jgi:small nuclear ribonucleoprotein (snRNP)-like protein